MITNSPRSIKSYKATRVIYVWKNTHRYFKINLKKKILISIINKIISTFEL